jgi:transposase
LGATTAARRRSSISSRSSFGDTRFVLEDFSTCRIADIEQARQIFGEAQAHADRGDIETSEELLAKAYDLVPAIQLVLTIEYTEDDDLAPLTGVILDLDDACFEVKIEAALEVARPQDFLKEFWSASQREPFDRIKWLRKNFSDYFAPAYRAVSPLEDQVRKEIKRGVAESILSVKFVYAQTKMDDTPSDKARTLSKTFEAPLVRGIPPIHSRRGPRRRRPAKLHGDKGYDYDHLRKWFRSRNITPRLARRNIESSQKLGRHRWTVERTVAWLSGCRRLHRRYERKAEHFLAFAGIAVSLICFRRLGG